MSIFPTKSDIDIIFYFNVWRSHHPTGSSQSLQIGSFEIFAEMTLIEAESWTATQDQFQSE